MRFGRIVIIVIATIVAIVSVGFVVGGGAMIWAFGTERDADGFFTSPDYPLATDGYALTSTDVDLATSPGEWFPDGLVDVRFDVTAGGDAPVFVGIGPSSDVAGYLDGVAIDQVSDFGPEESDVSYETVTGTVPAATPAAQDFWVASAAGTGMQTLTWDVAAGSWTVVVMNADASPGVLVTAEAGAQVEGFLAIAIAVLLFGLLLAGLAALLLVLATRSRVTDESKAAAIAPEAYPVVLEGSIDPGLSRWMWLVKWFLAIPHFVVLAFLWIAFSVLTVAAFFAILFTGRYPRAIFDFNVGVMRWSWRVSYYAFSALATDQYPPFTLRDVEYPARFDVAYPERLSRGLVLVKWWLLAIPHYLIVGVLTSGLVWWAAEVGGDAALRVGGGLIGILVLVAAIALTFTGRYPPGLFDLIMGLNRWVYRVGAYASLMRDEYPPFRLDMGGDDPGVVAELPPGSPPGGDVKPREPVLSRS